MTASEKGGVVLLHGIWNHSVMMLLVERALKHAGYATLNLSYPSMSKPLVELVDGLEQRISAFATSLDGPVHFVGHSLGGLMIRAYLKRHRPKNLGNVVMLGTPNHGSEPADFAYKIGLGRLMFGPVGAHLISQRTAADEAVLGAVEYPLGIIAGNRPRRPPMNAMFFNEPYDGKVSVSSTKLEGMTDHIILPVAHDAMPASAAVHSQIIAFLRNGAFIRPENP